MQTILKMTIKSDTKRLCKHVYNMLNLILASIKDRAGNWKPQDTGALAGSPHTGHHTSDWLVIFPSLELEQMTLTSLQVQDLSTMTNRIEIRVNRMYS